MTSKLVFEPESFKRDHSYVLEAAVRCNKCGKAFKQRRHLKRHLSRNGKKNGCDYKLRLEKGLDNRHSTNMSELFASALQHGYTNALEPMLEHLYIPIENFTRKKSVYPNLRF